MDKVLREEAEKIIYTALQAVQPDEAVRRTLKDYRFSSGRKILVAIGKAAWQMAKAATDTLNAREITTTGKITYLPIYDVMFFGAGEASNTPI